VYEGPNSLEDAQIYPEDCKVNDFDVLVGATFNAHAWKVLGFGYEGVMDSTVNLAGIYYRGVKTMPSILPKPGFELFRHGSDFDCRWQPSDPNHPSWVITPSADSFDLTSAIADECLNFNFDVAVSTGFSSIDDKCANVFPFQVRVVE